MRAFLILLISTVFSFRIIAQTGFVATASSQEIEAGTLISVSFKFSGSEDATNFVTPDFSPFRVYSGPSTARSMTIVNGIRSNELTYSYTLIAPDKEGIYTIGQASIKSAGKTYTSLPLRVKVKPVDARLAQERASEVFLELTLSKDTAYIGEGILYEAIIYYKNYNIEIGRALRAPDFENFKREHIPDLNFGRRNVQIINGQEYYYKVLDRSKLYPQQPGKIDLGELILPVNQIITAGYSASVRPLQLRSEPLEVFVRELPKPVPQDFIGAVGSYTVDFRISVNQLTTGQGFFIHTIIEGDGDAGRVSAPVFHFPGSVEVYEPKSREQKKMHSDNVVFEKVYEHFCLVGKPGKITLEPSVSYFDPDKNEYVRISERVDLTVVGEEITPDGSILYDGSNFKGEKSVNNKWIWILILAVLLLGGGLYLRKKQNRDFRDLKTPVVVFKTRDERLKEAETLMKEAKVKLFYDEIFRLWNDFIIYQCGIEQAEINRKLLKNALKEAGVATDIIERLENILNTCDMSLFADVDMSNKMESVLHESEHLLHELDSHFG